MFRKGITHGIYLNSSDFWLKMVFSRKKRFFLIFFFFYFIFFAEICFNDCKNIFFDKKHFKKLAKAIFIHVSIERFLTFIINFLFLNKFGQKSLKNHFFVKISFFLSKNASFSERCF